MYLQKEGRQNPKFDLRIKTRGDTRRNLITFQCSLVCIDTESCQMGWSITSSILLKGL